jgi:hypothetical protein
MKLLLATPLKLALALAACGLITSTHAAERLAAPPEFLSAQAGSPIGGARWQAVDDDVLSHQTGKAPGAEMVSGVVLDVMSQWQMPNGASATAHGRVTVATNADNSLSAQVSTSAQASDGANHGNHYGNTGGSAPLASATTSTTGTTTATAGTGTTSTTTVTTTSTTATNATNATNATPTLTATAGTGANPHASATGGQNVSVNGVSQITQVAGDNNTSSNSAVIDFNGSTSTTLAASGGAASNSNSNSNPSAQATSASGNVRAAISFGNGGVALTLQTPAGVASQTISPATVQGSGSIAQLVQVAGNAQAVVNQLQLSVQTQAMSGALLRQLGVLQAMQNSALPRR